MVGYGFGSDYEFGIAFDYLKSSTAGTVNGAVYDVWGELLYVALGTHANALYLGPKLGRGSVNNGTSTTDSTLFGGVIGKRFELFGSVSYDPNFSIIFSKSDAGTSNPDFRFISKRIITAFFIYFYLEYAHWK